MVPASVAGAGPSWAVSLQLGLQPNLPPSQRPHQGRRLLLRRRGRFLPPLLIRPQPIRRPHLCLRPLPLRQPRPLSIERRRL